MKAYGNDCTGTAMGDNAGKGNRAAAKHIKAMHKSGNAVSSTANPSMTVKPPGVPFSAQKQPKRSMPSSKILD